MSNPIKADVQFSDGGRVYPPIVEVTIANGAPFQAQKFINQSSAPVTLVLPTGVSPDGCLFGIPGNEEAVIRISACTIRNFEIPYGVFYSETSIRNWGEGNSPPTMKVGP